MSVGLGCHSRDIEHILYIYLDAESIVVQDDEDDVSHFFDLAVNAADVIIGGSKHEVSEVGGDS